MRIIFKIIAIIGVLSFLGGLKNGVFFFFGLILAGIFGYFGWRPENKMEKGQSPSPTEPSKKTTSTSNNVNSSNKFAILKQGIKKNNELSESALEKQIETLNQKKELLIRSYNDGLFKSKEYDQKISELEAEISKLNKLLSLKLITNKVILENRDLFERLLELKAKELITNEEYKFKYNELLSTKLQKIEPQNEEADTDLHQEFDPTNRVIHQDRTKTYYLLGFLLILLLVTVAIIFFQYSPNTRNSHSSYNITSSQANKSNTINQKTKDNLIKKDTQKDNKIYISNQVTENKVIKNTIILFDNINKIYPGETSFNEVKAILGEPDFIEQTKIEVFNGKMVGGDKVVKYQKEGIELLFARTDTFMSEVDGILIKKGFDGVSEEGIHIGMTKEKCLEILNEKYFLKHDLGECMYYSEIEGGEGDLQIWFKNGKLYKLKIFKKIKFV